MSPNAMKSDLMREHRVPQHSSNKKTLIFLLGFLVTLVSCKNGSVNPISRASDEAGTDVSACLSGTPIDYERVFAGPCEIHPAEEGENGPPDLTATISYLDLLAIVQKDDSQDSEAQIRILDCVAQAAFCVGETQCLSVASICQFALNCGSDDNPCEQGTGACNANFVTHCDNVQSKNECNTSYTQSCFDSQGGFTQCGEASAVQQDYRNCYWGVDSITNKTGCFSYGSTYGDGACTLTQ